ncbi:hypothetical protein T492DRAFT_873655 [Pavlovales sp. CCMP2436]|nr:hypothetical protein T492DRAFT_873655 [Pavlovales sp. CCMP2436]
MAQGLSEPLPWTSEIFQYVLQALYDDDVLPETVIVAWAAEAEMTAPEGSARKARCTQCQAFLTWLAEAESDDDEGEDYGYRWRGAGLCDVCGAEVEADIEQGLAHSPPVARPLSAFLLIARFEFKAQLTIYFHDNDST